MKVRICAVFKAILTPFAMIFLANGPYYFFSVSSQLSKENFMAKFQLQRKLLAKHRVRFYLKFKLSRWASYLLSCLFLQQSASFLQRNTLMGCRKRNFKKNRKIFNFKEISKKINLNFKMYPISNYCSCCRAEFHLSNAFNLI